MYNVPSYNIRNQQENNGQLMFLNVAGSLSKDGSQVEEEEETLKGD